MWKGRNQALRVGWLKSCEHRTEPGATNNRVQREMLTSCLRKAFIREGKTQIKSVSKSCCLCNAVQNNCIRSWLKLEQGWQVALRLHSEPSPDYWAWRQLHCIKWWLKYNYKMFPFSPSFFLKKVYYLQKQTNKHHYIYITVTSHDICNNI